jgi:hypothetical protein
MFDYFDRSIVTNANEPGGSPFMSDVSDILAQAALALRAVNQDELADVVMLLTLIATPQQIAAVRGAILTILQTP